MKRFGLSYICINCMCGSDAQKIASRYRSYCVLIMARIRSQSIGFMCTKLATTTLLKLFSSIVVLKNLFCNFI